MLRGKGVTPRYFYEEWMEKEGIPIYEALAGIEDITELPRRPWARLGGSGAFIQLEGTKLTGRLLYVVEIPAGGALEPEKHMYDELIYIFRGRGLAEVWQEGKGKPKHSFEWGGGSMFALPTNVWHRLVNGGRQPVLFLASTNAPVVMDAFCNTDFIFNCDYNFTDRYTGQADYFLAGEKPRYKEKLRSGRDSRRTFWDTNFVPDVRTMFMDDMPEKVAGGQITFFRISAWASWRAAEWRTGHVSEWPVGGYHKAHCHGPGAVLLGLKSVGYALVWPKEYGAHPYQDGHGDKVIRANWKPGGIYASGGGTGDWFHQHFNTGPEPARQLVVPGGGGVYSAGSRTEEAGHVSMRDGGSLVEYDDEDPEIRRMFQKELKKKGVEFTMKPVVYRTDPLPSF